MAAGKESRCRICLCVPTAADQLNTDDICDRCERDLLEAGSDLEEGIGGAVDYEDGAVEVGEDRPEVRNDVVEAVNNTDYEESLLKEEGGTSRIQEGGTSRFQCPSCSKQYTKESSYLAHTRDCRNKGQSTDDSFL